MPLWRPLERVGALHQGHWPAVCRTGEPRSPPGHAQRQRLALATQGSRSSGPERVRSAVCLQRPLPCASWRVIPARRRGVQQPTHKQTLSTDGRRPPCGRLRRTPTRHRSPRRVGAAAAAGLSRHRSTQPSHRSPRRVGEDRDTPARTAATLTWPSLPQPGPATPSLGQPSPRLH